MIIEEYFELDGVQRVRHYSDQGVMIASEDNIEYSSAEDLASLGKVYHETDTPIEDEITDEEAFQIIVGEAEE